MIRCYTLKMATRQILTQRKDAGSRQRLSQRQIARRSPITRQRTRRELSRPPAILAVSRQINKISEWKQIGKQSGIRLPVTILNPRSFVNQKITEGFILKGSKLVKRGKKVKITIDIDSNTGQIKSYKYRGKNRVDANYSNGFMTSYVKKDRSGRTTGTTKVDFVKGIGEKTSRRGNKEKIKTWDWKAGTTTLQKAALAPGGPTTIQSIPGFERGINEAVKRDRRLQKNLDSLRSKLQNRAATTTDIKKAGGLVLTDPNLKRRILRDSAKLRTLERKIKKEDKRGQIRLSVLKNKAKGKDVIFAEAVSKKINKQDLKKLAPQGSITVAPRPEGYIDGLFSDLRRKQEKIARDIELKKVTGNEAQFQGIVVQSLLGVGSAGLGIVTLVKDPIKTLKGTFEAFRPKNFRSTIQGEFDRFAVNPTGVVVEFLAFNKGLRLSTRAAKNTPVARTAREELFIRSQPKQVQGPVRTILEASRAQEKINPGRVNKLKKIDFAEVKEFKIKAESNAMKKTILQTDSVVFGSLPARTISKKRTPIPKDVDLATKNIATFNKKFLQNLPPKIRKNYKIKGQKIVRKSDGTAIADVKPISKLVPNRSLFTKRGQLPVVGYVYRVGLKKGLPTIKKKKVEGAITVPTQKLQKIGGIRVIGFGEQTTRKALGTIQVLIEKNARRAKDPQSLLVALQIQRQTLAKGKPKTPLGKLRKKRGLKKLDSAVKLLKSSSFKKLLEKKVPGLTKEFPLVAKINTKKLGKIKLKQAKQEASKLVRRGVSLRLSEETLRKRKGRRAKTKPKTTKKVKRTKKAVKRKPSKLPSKLPKRKTASRLPSRVPRSKLPSKVSIFKSPSAISGSFIPSSKLRSLLVSKLPAPRVPSRIPSKVPSSKLGEPITSRLPLLIRRIVPPVKLTPQRDEEERRKKLLEAVKKEVTKNKFVYIPDLYSRIYGIKASTSERKRFTQKGALFSGVAIRKLI